MSILHILLLLEGGKEEKEWSKTNVCSSPDYVHTYVVNGVTGDHKRKGKHHRRKMKINPPIEIHVNCNPYSFQIELEQV